MDKKNALKEYAALLRRVAAYAKWEWWQEENAHMRLHEEHHGKSKQTEEWRSITPPPEPSSADRKEIGISLAAEILSGKGMDPFPEAWEELRGAVAADSAVGGGALYTELGKRHEGFVSSFSYGWGNVAESAARFTTYLSGLPIYGKKDTPMTEEAFARKCGVSKRTVINWLNGRATPTVYFPDLQKDVTFSRGLLNNPIEAERFAMLYKQHRQIKRGGRTMGAYNGEATDREEIGRLTGYGGSSWHGYQ